MISPLWPVNALVVTVLLLLPRRVWPLLISAALGAIAFADVQKSMQPSSVIWLVVGNLVEVLIAALAISWAFGGVPRLDSVKALAKYSFLAVILGPFVAAFLGANPSVHYGYWTQWKLWFFSDGLAFLTLMPALSGWVNEGRGWARKSRAHPLEAAAIIGALFLFGFVIFVASGRPSSPALLYSLVPFLLWSALRFGSMGVSTSVFIVTVLSLWGAVHGNGPFSGPEPLHNVLSLQLFLFFTATPFMVLAAVVEEHKEDVESLKKSEEKFSKVFRHSPTSLSITSAMDYSLHRGQRGFRTSYRL